MMIYLLFIQNTCTENIKGIVELEQKCSICEDDKHVLQAAASSSGRRRSSVAQSKEFTKLVKDLQEDYAKKVFSLPYFFLFVKKVFFFLLFPAFFTVHSEGFDEKIAEETLANLNAKKPMKAAKKGTLKEKKDAMASLLNTVREDKDKDKAEEHREKGKQTSKSNAANIK